MKSDIRGVVSPLIGWKGATIARVVYCTARVDSSDNPSASVDQAIYLNALTASGSVDLIAEGRYVSWAKEEPLVSATSSRYRPTLYRESGEKWDARLPLRRGEPFGRDAGLVMATVRKREEKGSVGTVNPSMNPTAGALKGLPTDGVGGHWWRRLVAREYGASQLADPVGTFRKPEGW